MGSTELIVILAIVILVFGATAIPKLAKSVGQARKEFDKALKDDDTSEPNKAVES